MHRRNAFPITVAVLDALIVLRFGVRSLRQSCVYLAHASEWPTTVTAVETARALLILSLAASAVLLARGGRWTTRINLAQLPLRITFALLGESEYLSFGFLGGIVGVLPPSLYSQLALLGATAVLELLRSALQVFIAWRRSRARRQLDRAAKEARAD